MTVRIDLSHPQAAVPSDFLGLSFEASALPALASAQRSPNLARLLRSLGTGSLRFGGVTADKRVAWTQHGPVPRWASGAIAPGDLSNLSTLAKQSGWNVLLTVNLGHYDPAKAAQEAQAAHDLLGPRLAGIELGNEPDRFALKGLRGPAWSFSKFRRQFESYRAAIARAAPGIPIAGPDASSGEGPLAWVRAAAGAVRPDLLTAHYYPLSRCGYNPTVSDLLSSNVRRQQGSMLSRLAAIQRAYSIPLQVDETNNVSCKGQPGVSNTFASALWAADYIGRAMAAGLRGLNFHGLIGRPSGYSPLVATAKGLRAKPEWYALLLASSLAGTRPLGASVQGARQLTASTFLGADGAIRILLVNFSRPGATPLDVSLHVPGPARDGAVLRLSARSPYATSHVKLGGREVTASGAWSPSESLPDVYRGQRGRLALAMPASSAALVTLRLAKG